MWRVLCQFTLALLRVIVYPLRGLCWLIDEITGDHRRQRETEEKRQEMADRPPLDDTQFLEMIGLGTGEAPTALAVRRAIAQNCCLPSEALRPDESRVDIELLFSPPPNSPWMDLGGNWAEVLLDLSDSLGSEVLDDAVEEVFSREWTAAEKIGRLNSLRDIVAVFSKALSAAAPRHR